MSPSETNSPPVRVVIVDDHTAIRVVLAQIVETMGEGYRVVGQAGNAAETRQVCATEKPDLLLLDLILPGSPGVTLLKEIKAANPGLKVLVFSGNLDGDIVRQLLLAGVEGIISKSSPLDEFKSAIRSTARGAAYLCSESSEVVRVLVQERGQPPPVVQPELSHREQLVLRYLADGLSSKQIARKLGLSHYTVNNYRSKLIKKTGLHRAVQLSRYAAKIGLIDRTAGLSATPFG